MRNNYTKRLIRNHSSFENLPLHHALCLRFRQFQVFSVDFLCNHSSQLVISLDCIKWVTRWRDTSGSQLWFYFKNLLKFSVDRAPSIPRNGSQILQYLGIRTFQVLHVHKPRSYWHSLPTKRIITVTGERSIWITLSHHRHVTWEWMFTKGIINEYVADKPSKLQQSTGGLLLLDV